MKNKKKFIIYLDIAYWGIILITTFVSVINGFKSESFDFTGVSFKQLNIQHYLILVAVIVIFIVLNFIGSILKYFQMTLIYIGIKIAIRKFNKEKLDKIDVEKSETYYRDMIKEYSPAVLNYIDNFSIDKNTVVATLMSLQLKGIIDKQLNIINENIFELDENEKYIYNNISNLQNINFNEFERIVVEDCKKYSLLKEKENEKLKVRNKTVIFVIIIMVSIVLFPLVASTQNIILVIALLLLEFACIIALPIIRYSSISYVVMNAIDPYVRSKKAQEINEKLEGLKKYLEDFSIMQDRTGQELSIWEDYLIYSVIFNQNTKLIKEYENKINNK